MRTYIVLTNSDCNLRCSYCCECRKRAAVFNVEDNIDYLLRRLGEDAPQAGEKVLLYCIGGESLLHPQKLDTFFSRVKERIDPRFAIDTRFMIQTNGTLVTRSEQSAFLEKWRNVVRLGFSIDGMKYKHNRDRCGSFDACIDGLEYAKTLLSPEQITIKGTFTVEDIPRFAENVKYLLSLGVSSVKSNFDTGTVIPERLASLLAWQMCSVVDWLAETKCPTWWSELNDPSAFADLGCGVGDGSRCLGLDGHEYPCFVFASNNDRRAAVCQEANECTACVLKCCCVPCVAAMLAGGHAKRPWCAYTWARTIARMYAMLRKVEKPWHS